MSIRHLYKISSKENYKETQEYLFKKGYSWRSGHTTLLYIESYEERMKNQSGMYLVTNEDEKYFVVANLTIYETIESHLKKVFPGETIVKKFIKDMQLNLF